MDKVSECVKCGYEYPRHHPDCLNREIRALPFRPPGHVDRLADVFNVAWQYYETPPPEAGKYVVIVDVGRFGLPFVTTRTWSGKDWMHTGPMDTITHWLDGLQLP